MTNVMHSNTKKYKHGNTRACVCNGARTHAPTCHVNTTHRCSARKAAASCLCTVQATADNRLVRTE